jgi:hypothetical protein
MLSGSLAMSHAITREILAAVESHILWFATFLVVIATI